MLLHIHPFISSFFFLSNFLTLKFFVTLFSINCEALKIETWYTRGQWTNVSCIPESGCCCLLVLLFSIFLSLQFSNMKIYVTLSSETVRSRRLKLITHGLYGWMYGVYRYHAAALIHPFIFSFFFLSNFLTLKILVTLSSGTVRPRRLKLVTHVDSGQIYRVYRNHAAALIHPFIFHFSFSPISKH